MLLILVVSNETTRNLVGNGILALLCHPDQLRRLRCGTAPGHWSGPSTSCCATTAPSSLTRVVGEDLEVVDKRLRAGQKAIALLGAANRHPAAFENSEALELSVEAARANLADASLRAPFAGIVARRLVENFVNVQAKQPIAILHKLDTLTLSFDIPALDVAALGGGPRLVADLDGLPGQEFVTRLAKFSTLADPATQTYRLSRPRPLPLRRTPPFFPA